MNYLQQWQEQGYLHLRGVLDRDRVERLRQNCESVYEQWKAESTPENQPFGYCYEPQAWSFIHLNHPQYYRKHPDWLSFLLDAIADPLALQVLRAVFREEPVFMQSNLYIDPPGETRIGGWHRDCQFYTDDRELEKQHFFEEADPPRELHMHIPLVPTHATSVVPGSHNRWDTPEEEYIRRDDPNGEMPNGLDLQMEPGDLGFFHVNALHRGTYLQGVPRRTVAITFSRTSAPRQISTEWMTQWKGYIAFYQPWVRDPHYLDGVAPLTREFFQHMIETYGPQWKPEYIEGLEPEMQRYFTAY